MSIYSAEAASQPRATADDPLLVQLDSPLDCSMPGETASAMVSWNVLDSSVQGIQIFIWEAGQDVTQAKLWTNGSATGLLKTPSWVRAGMTFELRDAISRRSIQSEVVTCE